LLTATTTGTDETYTYDAVGNCLTGPTATDAATYNDGHQLTLAGTINYTYDANGNQLTRADWTQSLMHLQTCDGAASRDILINIAYPILDNLG